MLWSSQGPGCTGGSVPAQGSPANPGGRFGEGVLGESPRGSLWQGGALGAMPPAGARSSSLLSLPSHLYLFNLFFLCGKQHNETCPLQDGL